MSPEDRIMRILERHTSDTRAVVDALRRLIMRTAPELREEAQLGWGHYIYSHHCQVLGITPHHDHVSLHFFCGVCIDDPEHVLETSKNNMRHVKIRRTEELDEDKLVRLIRAAVYLDAA
jgi:hypothetical protein